jgi:aminopeptidase
MWPTPSWARLVHPDLDEDGGVEKLWKQLAHICRLDDGDPLAAWRERMDTLEDVATRLRERRFDALHFEGPGTDLTIGLLPSSRWWTARFSTIEGIEHQANLPSEEVFTSPDPERVEGVVASTKPLLLLGAGLISDLVVRFEGGRAVDIQASQGAEALRTRTAKDPGAARLGEVALVDLESRIGKLGTVFHHTLIDENAASHIALGNGFPFAVEDEADRPRINDSAIHIDFMIGSDEVSVTGVSAEGKRIPVLREGAWQI